MIKYLIRKFFSGKTVKDLKNQQNIRIKELDSIALGTKLEKGEVKGIFLPEFGTQKGFVVKKWNFKLGDIVKRGDKVCEIENQTLLMEFESYYDGKIVKICELNKPLAKGEEILKIEGV